MDDLPIIPVVYLLRLIEQMEKQNIGVDHVLQDCGIRPAVLTKPDAKLSLRQARAVILRYTGLSLVSFPGIRYGFHLDPDTHGLIGFLVTHRGSYRELLTSIIYYLKVRLPIGEWTVNHHDDYYSIAINCHPAFGELEAFLVQTVLGSLYKQGSAITKHISLHFTPQALPDIRGIRALIPVEVSNTAERNEIRFYASKTAHLDMQAGGPTPEEQESAPLQETGIMLSLRNYLLKQADKPVSLETAAHHLGVSVRTLRRKLENCAQSFTQIRQDIRMQLSLRYLKTSDISIERIASLVGYSDQACFTRAFRDWCGSTPLAVRQGHPRKQPATAEHASDTTQQTVLAAASDKRTRKSATAEHELSRH